MPAGLHPFAKGPESPRESGGRRAPVSPPVVATAFHQQSSRRMPEGLHCLQSARSRVRIPPGPTCGPVAQSVERERLSTTSSPRTTTGQGRRMLVGLHVEHPREREVGGSNPPPGDRIAQYRPPNSRRRLRRAKGRMPTGLHSTPGMPVRFRPGPSRRKPTGAVVQRQDTGLVSSPPCRRTRLRCAPAKAGA